MAAGDAVVMCYSASQQWYQYYGVYRVRERIVKRYAGRGQEKQDGQRDGPFPSSLHLLPMSTSVSQALPVLPTPSPNVHFCLPVPFLSVCLPAYLPILPTTPSPNVHLLSHSVFFEFPPII
ncbi:hypothetical protein Pcinc_005268 [Petrolisthes cinctipes]|uniref:Uncharacterized protein n=1 Tax=Petrolisthes cinctipes TaxID=88211 RepID=A0AAE1GFH6_PETCI|nr:hypothetical protein Pcinc_005268 [Petrolisthes cinctipes]